MSRYFLEVLIRLVIVITPPIITVCLWERFRKLRMDYKWAPLKEVVFDLSARTKMLEVCRDHMGSYLREGPGVRGFLWIDFYSWELKEEHVGQYRINCQWVDKEKVVFLHDIKTRQRKVEKTFLAKKKKGKEKELIKKIRSL